MNIAKYLSALLMPLLAASASQAGIITTTYQQVSGSDWYVDLHLMGDDIPTTPSGFTVYFDENIFSDLIAVATPDETWDTLVIQPDLNIPAPGFYDAYLTTGQGFAFHDATGFRVGFSYFGTDAPPQLSFDVVDANYQVLFSGVTKPLIDLPTTEVPEPNTIFLLALGLLAIFGFRSTRIKENTVKHTFIGSLLFATSLAAQAGSPSVEGIDLISSKRIDRTTFDFVFALRINADSKNYDSGTFSAKIDSVGSTLIKDKVSVGRIDAGSFFRTTDTITIRQDRTYPFNKDKLIFTFDGKLAASSNPSIGPKIGQVKFFELAGRPGHQGSLPITTDSPVAAAALTLQAALYGDIAQATYQFRDSNGVALTGGELVHTNSELAWYSANIVVPNKAFTVEINATGNDGKQNTWQSKLFTPQTLTAKLVPATGVFKYGQTIPASIRVVSASATGDFVISINRPSDFTGDAGPWTVSVTPGKTIDIPIKIIPPASGPRSSFYTLGLAYAPKLQPQNVQFSNLEFFAK